MLNNKAIIIDKKEIEKGTTGRLRERRLYGDLVKLGSFLNDVDLRLRETRMGQKAAGLSMSLAVQQRLQQAQQGR